MDSGIGLELGFWIRDPEMGQGALKSAINRRILGAFRENRIEIPYPRRDIHWVDPEKSSGPPAGAPPVGP
jgi:small-conductance mechanosensitive channel